MRKGSVGYLAALIMLGIVLGAGLAGCGDDGGARAQNISTPSISNLTFFPTSATFNQGGGAITVNGSYHVIDNGGDVTGGMVTIKLYDHNNVLTNTYNSPITAMVNGVTSGTLSCPATVPTTAAGTFHFVLYITDGAGNKSNELTGTFTVLSPAPVVASFQSEIAKYTMSAPSLIRSGDPVPVTVSITNTSSSALTIVGVHILIRRNNIEFYRTPYGTALPEALTIIPGETKTVSMSWNGKDNNGNSVPPGEYELVSISIGNRETTGLLVAIDVE